MVKNGTNRRVPRSMFENAVVEVNTYISLICFETLCVSKLYFSRFGFEASDRQEIATVVFNVRPKSCFLILCPVALAPSIFWVGLSSVHSQLPAWV